MPSLDLSDEEFVELVAKDVLACRMKCTYRPDITPMLENPARWREALNRVYEEALVRRDHYKQKEKELDRKMYSYKIALSFLYKCQLRIMECDRILYLRQVGPEHSIARMLSDKIAEHKKAKGESFDEHDEALWTALSGAVVYP